MTFHGLRHSHATFLASINVNSKAMQERMGHKDIQTTLRYYIHGANEMQDTIAARQDTDYAAQRR